MKTKLRVFSIEVTASEKEQMEEEGIIVRLRKVRLVFLSLLLVLNLIL